MAQKVWLGSKLRRLRRQRHLAQAEVARRLGISASYLNLIEHNQRPLTVPLQIRLAEVLEVEPGTFSRDEEARLLADLLELIGDPAFPEHELDQEKLHDLIDSVPEAGRSLLVLFQAYRRTLGEVEVLAEKLSGDTFLSTSTHELRNLLATIRSFAEILHDNADLSPARRQQFQGIVVEQSERLTENINRMLAFAPGEGFKSLDTGGTPAEAVTEFVQSRGNFFPELEAVAVDLRNTLCGDGGADRIGAEAYLRRALGVTVEMVDAFGETTISEHFDGRRRVLRLCSALAPASLVFRVIRRIALLRHSALLESTLDQAGLSDAPVRRLGTLVLANYLAASVLMPYDEFLEAAEAQRYDVERLQIRFGVSFEQACHRLTSLRQPDRAGVPFHFLRADIAGNITKQFSATGLRIPKFGFACPRWNVHTAFMNHGLIQTQVAELTDRSRFLMIARSLTKPGIGWGDPPSHYAIALGCRIEDAAALVYGDGLALGPNDGAEQVGTTCRLCERLDCRQRAAPPLLAGIAARAPDPVLGRLA